MKTMRWLVLFAAAAILSAGPLQARDKGARKGKQPEESVLDQLNREVKLTDEQQAKVKAKLKERDDALAKWDADNAEKIEQAEEAARKAKASGDAEAKKAGGAKLRELRKERQSAAPDVSESVMEILTDEQKAVWRAFETYQSVVSRYRRIELSDEQQAQIRMASEVAAGEMSEDGSDTKGDKEILNKLRWGIEVFVLTPEQRERNGAGRGRNKKGEQEEQQQDKPKEERQEEGR